MEASLLRAIQFGYTFFLRIHCFPDPFEDGFRCYI